MVVVVVRDKYLPPPPERRPRHREPPGDAVAGINDIGLIVNEENVGRLRSAFASQRPTLRTQRDQRRLRCGLLGDDKLQRRDEHCEAEDKSNRIRTTDGGSRTDHAVTPEEASRNDATAPSPKPVSPRSSCHR